jgi:hypothetical protein
MHRPQLSGKLMQSSTHRIEPIAGNLSLRRAFYCVAALALVSLCLAVAGRLLGHGISLGGHTEDRTLQEIVIGNSVLELPANMIRFDKQRRNGVAERVDIYLHWPDMQGYQPESIQDFNGSGSEKRLLFLTFEPRAIAQDMSGRYGPIYSTLTNGPGIKGPAGLTIQGFQPESGFVNEELVVSSEQAGKPPFVARCRDAETSEGNLASCQRDIFVGEDLQLTYRFPREMLKDWQPLEQQMLGFAKAHIKGPQ